MTVRGLASFCLWVVWKARNKVFDDADWSPEEDLNMVVELYWEFTNSQQKCMYILQTSQKNLSNDIWSCPPDGVVKCNVDATFVKSSLLGGGNVVFQDLSGAVLQAVVLKPFLTSWALSAEASCFRSAVGWARTFNFQKSSNRSHGFQSLRIGPKVTRGGADSDLILSPLPALILQLAEEEGQAAVLVGC
ncbi:uncharacterized protein LOC132279448 [Cornus florida]|uniref:uncharacterized protein LOC132279448 n=1 Tax=Cornus florida TaxID=4283 RepID=UPI0028998875|nr:uncharacterized protein LOC132279448 [Cornus florida]